MKSLQKVARFVNQDKIRPLGGFTFITKYDKICFMKKFNRLKHKTMGAMPDELRKIAGLDAATATEVFNQYITDLATDFHTQLANGTDKSEIKLTPKCKLFGMDVKLDYVASGSIGSVYKIQIGNSVFALKINRNSSHGELRVMPLTKCVRGLVNKTYMGSVFSFDNRKYSWVLSDFVVNDYKNSFSVAMQKLYFAYLAKGIDVSDAHPNNFMAGKLIDVPSLGKRNGKIDDINNLTRTEQDTVQQLTHYIRTNNLGKFTELTERVKKTNPAVIQYMFFAMKYAKGAVFSGDKTDEFSVRLKSFDAVMNDAWAWVRPGVSADMANKIQQVKIRLAKGK